nr:hypothetical protein [Tanacetum cinerariifolium]
AKVKGLCRGSGRGSWGSSGVWWSGAEVKEMDWSQLGVRIFFLSSLISILPEIREYDKEQCVWVKMMMNNLMEEDDDDDNV